MQVPKPTSGKRNGAAMIDLTMTGLVPEAGDWLIHSSILVPGGQMDNETKEEEKALAGVAQWIEGQPASRGVTGSIPSWGTCLDCGPGPQWGPRGRQPHIVVSLSFSFPTPLSKNK